MTKKEVKDAFGKPRKEKQWSLHYKQDLEFHFKLDGTLYLAAINPSDDSAPIALVFDDSVGNLSSILATVL